MNPPTPSAAAAKFDAAALAGPSSSDLVHAHILEDVNEQVLSPLGEQCSIDRHNSSKLTDTGGSAASASSTKARVRWSGEHARSASVLQHVSWQEWVDHCEAQSERAAPVDDVAPLKSWRQHYCPNASSWDDTTFAAYSMQLKEAPQFDWLIPVQLDKQTAVILRALLDATNGFDDSAEAWSDLAASDPFAYMYVRKAALLEELRAKGLEYEHQVNQLVQFLFDSLAFGPATWEIGNDETISTRGLDVISEMDCRIPIEQKRTARGTTTWKADSVAARSDFVGCLFDPELSSRDRNNLEIAFFVENKKVSESGFNAALSGGSTAWSEASLDRHVHQIGGEMLGIAYHNYKLQNATPAKKTGELVFGLQVRGTVLRCFRCFFPAAYLRAIASFKQPMDQVTLWYFPPTQTASTLPLDQMVLDGTYQQRRNALSAITAIIAVARKRAGVTEEIQLLHKQYNSAAQHLRRTRRGV